MIESTCTTGTVTALADCQPPGTVWLDNYDDSGINVNWDSDPLTNTWELVYRIHIPEGTNDVPWTTFTVEGVTTKRLTSLSANQDYEFKLKPYCSNFGWTEYGPISVFNNSPCGAPANVTEEATSSTTLKLSWTGSGLSTFTVMYRPLGVPGAQYATVNTNYTFVELTGLQTGQIYEYTIAANCFLANTSFTYQGDFEIERKSLDNEFYECGVDLTPPNLDAVIPIFELREGDTIVSGDFTVIIKQAGGSQGYFTGTGYLPVPYLNMARVNVEFRNILVNTDYRVVFGDIVITGAGVKLLNQQTADLQDDFLNVLNTVDDILTYAEDIIAMAEEIIAVAEKYLADNIVQQLDADKEALQDAIADGDQAAITAAKNQLDVANTAFKTELSSFFQQFFTITKTTLPS